jgi:hypothetical protein
MSGDLPLIRLAIPSPMLNDPTWAAEFRRLARELLDIARDMERFGSMPSYQHTIFRMRWLPHLEAFAQHFYRVVEEGRQKGESGVYHESIFEPFQIACAMLDEIARRTDADPARYPIPLVALTRINELLAQQTPPAGPPAALSPSGTAAPSDRPEGEQNGPPAAGAGGTVVRQPSDPLDEDAIADALAANGRMLEAVFVRHFKGRWSTTCQDLIEAVAPDERGRDWATVKTWVNRVKNALLEYDPRCRLSFHTSSRDLRVIKRIAPE